MITDMPCDFKISKVKRDFTQGVQPQHSHPYYEVFYLINGDCTFFIEHNIYKLNRGDLVIVPKGAIHKSTFPVYGVSERFVVCFKDSNLLWLDELLGKEIRKETFKAGVISIPDKRREYVESLMQKMLFESEGQDILSPAFIKTGLLELILFMIRCQRFERNVMKEIDVDNRLMQEIATYIYENYEKKLSLDELSERFHISKSYLSKKFKAITGTGIKEYIIHVRIKNACTLLLETNKSITDIAFECGFNDSNYFGDAFKHMKGMSPNKYRRNKETM